MMHKLKLMERIRMQLKVPLHKKWSFPSRISSVNMTKSAVEECEEILNGLQSWNVDSIDSLKHKVITFLDVVFDPI